MQAQGARSPGQRGRSSLLPAQSPLLLPQGGGTPCGTGLGDTGRSPLLLPQGGGMACCTGLGNKGRGQDALAACGQGLCFGNGKEVKRHMERVKAQTPWLSSHTNRAFAASNQPAALLLPKHRHKKRTALRWRMQCAALAIAPRCVGRCSALRWRLQCAALADAPRCVYVPSPLGEAGRGLSVGCEGALPPPHSTLYILYVHPFSVGMSRWSASTTTPLRGFPSGPHTRYLAIPG